MPLPWTMQRWPVVEADREPASAAAAPQAPRAQANLAQAGVRLRAVLLQLLALGMLVLALLAGLHPQAFEPALLRDVVLSFGYLAPLAYAVLYAAAVFVPFAASIVAVAGGLAFGTLWGGVFTYLLTLFASLAPMALARWLGRARVEAWIGNTRVQRYADLINRNAFLVFLYLRLIPSIPYELQNYIAGVSRIRYREFLLAGALGNAPVIFIMAAFGDSLTAPGSVAFWLAAGLFAASLLVPLLVALIWRRWRGESLLARLANTDTR